MADLFGIFLVLGLIKIALFQVQPVANVIVSTHEAFHTFNTFEQISKLELDLRETPDFNYAASSIYSSSYGTVLLIVLRPGSTVRNLDVNSSAYYRTIKGVLRFETSDFNYTLHPRDGLLYPGGKESFVSNPTTEFTAYFKVRASNADHQPYHFSTPIVRPNHSALSSPIIRNSSLENDESKSNVDLGHFFMYGKPLVDINGMGQRLMNQGVRLTSSIVALSEGISCTMFVLRGVSGCHKHTRSDYISWNALGGSFHRVLNPMQFDTNENDAVIIVKNLDHNLISHRIKVQNLQEDVNIMLLFQFPAQTSSDSAPAFNCI